MASTLENFRTERQDRGIETSFELDRAIERNAHELWYWSLNIFKRWRHRRTCREMHR